MTRCFTSPCDVIRCDTSMVRYVKGIIWYHAILYGDHAIILRCLVYDTAIRSYDVIILLLYRSYIAMAWHDLIQLRCDLIRYNMILLWYYMIRYGCGTISCDFLLCCDSIWCDIIWYITIWYGMIRCDSVLLRVYRMVRYDMLWYDTLCYDMIFAWYDMIIYCIIWYRMGAWPQRWPWWISNWPTWGRRPSTTHTGEI